MMEWKGLTNRKVVEKDMQDRLLRSYFWRKAKTIAMTISKGLEWDTQYLIKKGWEQGKTITLPISNKKTREMNFYKYHRQDPLENRWADILEPIADDAKYVPADHHDLIIVPGLLFNHSGYRIGYGGGFYDRYLRYYNGISLSLAADFQLKQGMESETHDKPVDVIVTNFGTLYCSNLT